MFVSLSCQSLDISFLYRAAMVGSPQIHHETFKHVFKIFNMEPKNVEFYHSPCQKSSNLHFTARICRFLGSMLDFSVYPPMFLEMLASFLRIRFSTPGLEMS